MYSFVLQDWVTIFGDAPTTTDIVQSEPDWLSFQAYQDIVFYTECKSFDTAGATGIQVVYETSPTKDESLFKANPMATRFVDLSSVGVDPVILATAAFPLARWVRWRLHLNGVGAGAWHATIRLNCAANAGRML